MATVFGIDGEVSTARPVTTDCCPADIDIDRCAFARNMIGLLPSGPIWDEAKERALMRNRCRSPDIVDCEPVCEECDESPCTSLADYAAFVGFQLYDAVFGMLIPALRETNAATSITSTAEWLERYSWESCFKGGCWNERLGYTGPFASSPIDCNTATCVGECPDPIPDDLATAVDQGIVEALRRLSLGPRRNLAGLNFILAPLNVTLEVDTDTAAAYVAKYGDSGSCCPRAFFTLRPLSDTVPLRYLDGGRTASREVTAWYRLDCNVGPVVWPSLLAAHCIALSLLPEDPCDTYPPIRWGDCEVN